MPICVLSTLLACGSHDGEDIGNLIFGGGGTIPREKLGVQNEFAATPKGDTTAQANDIGAILAIRHVRTSFFFDEGFLSSENATPNFARFDEIVAAMPADTDLLPILAYAPSWLADRADWKDVFVARYVIPVLDRYGRNPRIAGWEIWNEPDGFCNGRVAPVGVLDCSARDYVDLVRRVAPVVRARSDAPIVGAATTSINQSFPSHLDYNKDLVDAGLLAAIDVYNFHWYGEQLEKLSLGGIADFLNGTGKRLWCTESGERGSTRQLAHAAQVFPAFDRALTRLERIYVFTYFDGETADTTFGLVAADGTESDLYGYLRDHR